ncbi:Tat pathway signal protein [Azorhizobium oxalatiphilum]|uniref:Tat pathway signal protein n=1 Tax=Azorhizobium oxalatiphilum TaxID=980631 RepID=A0A917BWT3_9HYPH|nr:DUF1513 domain-containing protein [Azorhizobium oxalatiphilum]GGF59214.1 Tat pathway signal protein [Azorhizobium oxalatiphilum]
MMPANAFADLHALDHALEEGWLTTAGIGESFAAIAVGKQMDAAACAATPARLHGIEASPNSPLAVAVGRRPGHVALVFDRRQGGIVREFTPGAGRVFSGHGRFSPDGKLFLTNEIERGIDDGTVRTMGRGVVAARSVEGGFAIVDEWATGGDGPHDLMRVGETLVVANGGIEPHTPEARDAEITGSSIALLHPETGAQTGEGRLSDDLASLSLRHLARDGRGGVVVAAQDLLKDGVARPLLFSIAKDGALTAFDGPEGELMQLRGYVGSVAIDTSGTYVACSSPRGGRIIVWRRDGRFIGSLPLIDGCGIARMSEPGRFLATSGYGEVIVIAVEPDGLGVVSRSTGGPRFDNHMAVV